ncbi:nitroreductase family protein [Anaerococcus urinomassiliensis]|uniref:nitroreductase family protein n=1 Tax=Anaerococcus urinomassiliensis TaxID=1745712 RepID=UPI00093A0CFE|nr:nitroreductase family protein [Anaerococcus urinomassiliensis]
MDFYDVLSKRVSTRKFTDEKVNGEDIKTLIDAANKAPIAMGQYDSSRLTVIEDRNLIKEISQEYKDFTGKDSDALYNAPVFIIFSSNKDNTSKYEDAGCVLENIALAATNLNLGSCYIRGLVNKLGNEAKYIDKLMLDRGYYPVSGIIVGHSEDELKGKDHKILTNHI